MAEFDRTLFFIAAFVLNLTFVNGGCGFWQSGFNHFQCETGECFENEKKCNDIKDCPGGEDEAECPTKTVSTVVEVPNTAETFPEFRKEIPSFEESIEFETPSNTETVTSISSRSWRGDIEDSEENEISYIDVNPSFIEANIGTTRAPEQEITTQGIVKQNVPCPQNVTLADGKCCYTVLHCESCNSTLSSSTITTTTTTSGPTDQSTITITPTPYRYFACGSGEMIPYSKRCNRQNDCKDGSDEYQCSVITTTTTPKSTCAQNEFTCNDGTCIPNNIYCDGEIDCLDGSDEKDCKGKNEWNKNEWKGKMKGIWKPKIVQLPKFKVELVCVDPSEPNYIPRQALQLECKFVGEPNPKVFWKNYEGTVPSKCYQSSRSGHGVLLCPNFEPSDQGAYSCVAENAAGAAESQPKSIAVCSNQIPCSGFKVEDEQKITHCLDCYCSNKTNECHNIKSIVKPIEILFPETETDVFVDKSGKVIFIASDEDYFPPLELQSASDSVTYCSVHESILKQNSFVKSYGRNINVPRYGSRPTFASDAPDLIIRGDGLTLTYSFNNISHSAPSSDVRFWRGDWRDLENNVANRIQLMRVLAHLDLLLIRCEYEKGYTELWDKKIITLESATIANYSDSVSYLELCICPEGYSGLSCEVCATGYHREKGTEDCVKSEPPPTPPPCKEGYIGNLCDKCDVEKGYHLDQYTRKCSKTRCHVNGTLDLSPLDRCICKINVIGEYCDQCKEGSFNLNAMDSSGCTSCWCNGVTTDCKSLNYYRNWISSTSYGGYNSSDGRHFWLLPSEFNGNRLTSYGGNLEYTIRYESHLFPQRFNESSLTVEILSQNNVTIICTHPNFVRSPSSYETSWRVPIEESYWRDRENRILSRFEILQILVYVQAIYIESPFHLSSGRANLTSVSLDTVSSSPGEDSISALEVEECRCPEGYEGFSCEICAAGYTRDKNDRRKCVKCNCSNCDPEIGCKDCPENFYDRSKKGSKEAICELCPCSGNERSCHLDDFSQVHCVCKAGFSGMKCEHKVTDVNKSQLKVTISPNKVKNRHIGTKIEFKCSYDSTEEMIIRFKKVYGNEYDSMDNGFELPSEDMVKTNKFGSMKSLEVILDKGLTHVECFVFNSFDMEVGRVMAVIEGTVYGNTERPIITNCYVGSHEMKEGDSLELICQAKGVPPPKIAWYRKSSSVFGDLDLQLITADGVHSIENATLTDDGVYFCQATNEEGSDSCTHHVIVRKKCLTLNVKPEKLLVIEGDSFTLTCKASEEGRITWTSSHKRLPKESIHNNGRLTISDSKIEDSGNYTCLFTSITEGSINKTAEVIVEKRRFGPRAIIRESDQTIEIGSNFEINCDVTGYPEPNVTWTAERFGRRLDNVQLRNNGRTLLIEGARKDNEGFYHCSAHSSEGNHSSQIYIVVRESLIKPRIRIRPNSVNAVLVGEELEIECVVEAGKPNPKITWVRVDGGRINAKINDGLLSISKVDLDHSGRYTCIAVNNAGLAEAAMEIDVLYPPIIEVDPKEVRVYNGTEVIINCIARGNPKPRIEWVEQLKNSRRDLQSPSKRITTEHQTFVKTVIQALPEINQYVCYAENAVGKASVAVPFYVQVYSTPFEPGISKIAKIGSRFVIECEGVQGIIKWSKLDGSFQGDECETAEGLLIPSVQIQHRGTYVCKSTNVSPVIEKRITLYVDGFVNKFSQTKKSFLVLPVKPKPNDLKIDITFRSEKPNGLILLEKADQLFSLYMNDSKVFFVLNFVEVGNLVIGHNAILEPLKWYTAIITIGEKHADLLIYGEDGKEIGSLAYRNISQNFNLNEVKEIFVGGSNITSQRLKNKHIPVEAFESFDGCISRFIQNEHEYKITEEGLYSKSVTLCERCSEIPNPCQAEEVCFDAPSQYGFVCVCPNGKIQKETSTCTPFCKGLGCETEFDFCKLLNPCNINKYSSVHGCTKLSSSLHCDCADTYSGTICEFATQHSFHVNGDGYVRLPWKFLTHDFGPSETIEMEFTTEKNEGLLLWQGDESDYLYIALIEGRIQYVYQNQEKPLKVMSSLNLSMNSKHHFNVIRSNNTVILEVNNDRIKSSTDFSTNRVQGDVYVGGLPNEILDVARKTVGQHAKGLSGCINYVILGASKSKINILEKDITFHKAEKQCSAQKEVDNITSEEVSEEWSGNAK